MRKGTLSRLRTADSTQIRATARLPKSREELWCACCCDEDGLVRGKRRGDLWHKPKSVIEYFRHMRDHGKIKKKKVAVRYGTTELTYAQLDELSTSLAIQIRKSLGDSFVITNPDEELVIGVSLPMTEKTPIVIFAVLKLGIAYLPLGQFLPEKLLYSIMEQFGPIAVITDDAGPILRKYDAEQFNHFTKVLSLEQLWLSMEEFPKELSRSARKKKLDAVPTVQDAYDTPVNERPAYVTYTTGFHSHPRGIRIGHGAILNKCLWEWKHLPYERNSVVSVSTIYFVEGFISCCNPLLQGASVHIFPRSVFLSMGQFIHQMYEKKITRLHLMTSLFGKFLAVCEHLGEGAPEFDHLQYVFVEGASMIPVAAASRFFDLFPFGKTLVGLCGPPECCGAGLYCIFKKAKEMWKNTLHGQIVVGDVWDNTTIYIMNDNRELMREGVQGAVCISGPNVAMGYVDAKNVVESKKFFPNMVDRKGGKSDIFFTGFYGRIEWVNGKNRIVFEGRIDSQVETNGFLIKTQEFYELLKKVKGVQDALVLTYKPYSIEQDLVAFVEGAESEKNIVEALSTRLPVDSLPYIVVTAQFPRIGDKPIIYELIRMFQESRDPTFEHWNRVKFSKDITEAVRVLAEAMYKFAGILEETTINNLNSTFYHLGGSSLNTLSVLLHLHRQGYTLSLYDLVTAKSIYELAELITVRPQRRNRALTESKSTQSTIKKNIGYHPILAGMQQFTEFEVHVLRGGERKSCLDILSKAYARKGALERFNFVHEDDFFDFFNEFWRRYADKGVSLMLIRTKDRKIIGVSLNQDYFTDPWDYTRAKSVATRVNYFHELKGRVLDKVPHFRNCILDVCFVGTHESLTPSENVVAATMLMQENLRVSKIDGFSSIFVATAHPLFQELCLDVMGFTLLDVQMPKYYEDKHGRPFSVAPESLAMVMTWLVTGDLPRESVDLQQEPPGQVQQAALMADSHEAENENEHGQTDGNVKKVGPVHAVSFPAKK